ncbi:MAG: 2TM domain-containing protein [Bacteroidia bacterium]|nr:2TM domain-containing protein [Bacteroidia bacterium]
MYEEVRKKAKKKVEAKVAFYMCAVIFSFTSVILLMLSFYLPGVAFWLRLPIPVFMMVLIILYLTAFGLPFSGTYSEDWREEEIEKEMIRLYRKKRAELPPLEELSESERLELKELERLREKWDWGEDYV